ncbi:FUSC family protein [Promicromonospora sp. Marseille-Q5078]
MTVSRRLPVALHRAWVLHPRWSLAFRGAIAAALAWTVAVVLPAPFSDYPYYAPLGAVVATTSTLARSARESLQTIAALVLGAGVALAADAVLPTGALSIALVVGVALLCAGWRVFGESGVWVANSAIFVLVLGRGQDAEYVGAYAGLIVLGAVIGTAVNVLLPPLYLTPSELALDRLRDALADELRDLAGSLEDEGPLEPDVWERRRREMWPTAEVARAAVARSGEASRGNPRAWRHGGRARTQSRRAEELGTAAGVVDEIVRLLLDWEHTGRTRVALGPRLRPELAATLRSFADALLDAAGHDDTAQDDARDDGPRRAFAGAVERLRGIVRDARDRSGDDYFVASALVVVLRRSSSVLVRS